MNMIDETEQHVRDLRRQTCRELIVKKQRKGEAFG